MKLATIAFFSLVIGSWAATISSSFTGGGGSNLWNSAANWSPTGVPANNNYAATVPGSFDVLLNSSRSIESLTIAPAATLTLSGSTLTLADSMHCDGVLEMVNATGGVGISFNNVSNVPVTLTGAGTIRLNDSTHRFNNSDPLTTGPDLTIEGYGSNTSNSPWTVRGLLNANVSGQPFTKSGGTLHLDGGEIRAENGGMVELTSTQVTGEQGGRFTVHDGSVIQFGNTSLTDVDLLPANNDSSISNHVFRVAPTALSVTMKDVRNASRFEIPRANSVLALDGTLVNDGEIVFTNDLTGTASISVLNDRCRLEGSGRLILAEPSKHRIIGGGPTDVLINGPQHRIEGSGEIGRILTRFENEGHIVTGGTLNLRMGPDKDYFINKPTGCLTLLSGSRVNAANDTNGGARFVNEGLLDIGVAAIFDAGNNHTLSNALDGFFSQRSGELRLGSGSVLEADSVSLTGGIVTFVNDNPTFPVQHTIRSSSLSLGDATVFRIGTETITFAKAEPYTAEPTGCLIDTSVVEGHFGEGGGDARAEIEIKSNSEHGRIAFDANFVYSGNFGYKLLYTGETGALPMGESGVFTSIPILTGGMYTYPKGVPLGEGSEIVCDGVLRNYVTLGHGGIKIPAHYTLTAPRVYTARERTYDGRVDFQGNYRVPAGITARISDSFVLTDPVFATELTPQAYSYPVPESTLPGTVIATITKPASMPGTPVFHLIGESPFAIDEGSGVLTLARSIDFETGPTSYEITINVFDDDNVQINPTTFSISDVAEDLALCVREILNGPNGPFANESDPAIISPDADPDGDDISNVMELWLRTDPAVFDPLSAIVLSRYSDGSHTYATLQVEVDAKIDDLLGVQGTFSSDLVNFRPGTRTVQTDNGYLRRLLFVDSVPVTGATFARCQAELSVLK